MNVLEELGKIGIVPVIKIDDPAKALPLAKALVDGGIACAEITFRTAQGEEAIRRICGAVRAGELPQILVGAGTVLTIAQVDAAIQAGASFVVSPGFNPTVVAHCLEKKIPIVPGCSTPSDMELAIEAGLDAVKFFPAEQAGGLDYIKAVAAPFHALRFMPTGGINVENIGRYTAFGKILGCGGSWMAGAELIEAELYEEISARCRGAIRAMLGFSFVHMGINCDTETAVDTAASRLGELFGFDVKPGNGSFFAGETIEIMKKSGGAHGHIGIAVNSVPKAMYHLGRSGVEFKEESIRTDASGRANFVYLKEEIGGFAVHLVQRK